MAKRTELAVGQVWAYNRSRQVRIGQYGYGWEKVTIVSTTPAKKWNRYSSQWVETSTGQGVLVEYTERRNGIPTTSQKIVQLSQLHMMWDKYETELAEYNAQREIAEAKVAIAKAEKETFMAETYNPALAELRKTIKDATGKDFTDYIKDARYAHSWEVLPIEVINFLNQALTEKANA